MTVQRNFLPPKKNMDSGFVIQNGVKLRIKRKRFEEFLEELSAV